LNHQRIIIWAASWQNQHNGFATSMDPDQPAHPPSLIRIHAVRLPTLLQVETLRANTLHGSWSDCVDAQAGLDPCWSQTHYVGFVVTRLIILSLLCLWLYWKLSTLKCIQYMVYTLCMFLFPIFLACIQLINVLSIIVKL
jgi:hypothetical protein